MGKLNFRGYLISRFFPTREIRENLMQTKNMCFTVLIDFQNAFTSTLQEICSKAATKDHYLVSLHYLVKY